MPRLVGFYRARPRTELKRRPFLGAPSLLTLVALPAPNGEKQTLYKEVGWGQMKRPRRDQIKLPKAGSPYAGFDVSEGVVWYSYYAGSGVPTNYPPPYGSGVLTPATGIESFTTTPQNPPDTWGTGFRPLGEIITKP
jgi:hypothetical protein